MNDAQFIGMLIGGLATIVGFGVLVFTPLAKLVGNVAKTNEKLDNIDKTLQGFSSRIDEHDNRLNAHDIKIAQLEAKKGK